MKRNITSLLLLPALLSVAGCSDKIAPDGRVTEPIQLYAAGDGLSAASKAADAAKIEPFGTTIFASTQSGIYTALDAPYEWTKAANVAANGSVSFTDNSKPSYPETGGWIYLVAVAPTAGNNAIDTDNGTVTYTLNDTPQDLLYAKEIRGSRWDNQRFFGNSDVTKDQPLVYNHLLAQLKFEARKADDAGLAVQITKITVNNVQTKATVALADGTTTFADPKSPLNLTPANDGVKVNSTSPVEVGNLFVPPLQSGTYTITVETSVGTFPNVSINFTGDNGRLKAGVSNMVTLTISDTSLGITSVKVAEWTTVPQGEFNLVE